jgi:enamine deaminase RidA (YjgF/YER057c/UK114 family)
MTIERHGSGGPFEETYGYSRVVKAGPFFLTAGCTSIVDGKVLHPGDAGAQAWSAFGIALTALAGAGAPVLNVVRTRMFASPAADLDAIGRAHGQIFAAVRPAATLVVVAGFVLPELLVEVEVEAYVP